MKSKSTRRVEASGSTSNPGDAFHDGKRFRHCYFNAFCGERVWQRALLRSFGGRFSFQGTCWRQSWPAMALSKAATYLDTGARITVNWRLAGEPRTTWTGTVLNDGWVNYGPNGTFPFPPTDPRVRIEKLRLAAPPAALATTTRLSDVCHKYARVGGTVRLRFRRKEGRDEEAKGTVIDVWRGGSRIQFEGFTTPCIFPPPPCVDIISVFFSPPPIETSITRPRSPMASTPLTRAERERAHARRTQQEETQGQEPDPACDSAVGGTNGPRRTTPLFAKKGCVIATLNVRTRTERRAGNVATSPPPVRVGHHYHEHHYEHHYH